MPAASVKVLARTLIIAEVVLLGVGVKVAEYEVPDPVKAEREPPAKVISAEEKSMEDSLRVKVKLAVSPDFREDLSEVMRTVGITVSTVIESCVTAALLLPAASVKVLAWTLMVAGVVLLLAGVKVAEYEVPDPVKADSVPPATVTSVEAKSVEDSLRVKVRFAVSPDFREDLSEVITRFGITVSTVIESWEAAELLLPAASVKVLAKTLILAGVVLLLAGVKVAE